MKTVFKLLTLAFCVSLISFGCKPEQSVDPQGKDNSPQAGLADEDPYHNRPDPQCMSSVFSDLVDNQGNTVGGDPFTGVGEYGYVEAVNSPVQFSILLSMGFYWLAADGAIFVGQCANVPLLPDGSVNWEAFQWGSGVPVVQYYQWDIPNSALDLDANGCACVVVAIEGVQSDFFGNAFNNTRLWALGDRTVGTNGRAVTACPVQCPYMSHGACFDVNPAAGRTTTTLSVTSSTVGQPNVTSFTFTWYASDRTTVIGTEVNATGTSSKTITTTTGGTWYVSVRNNISIFTDWDTIVVGNNTCGIVECSIPHPTPTSNLSAYDCTPGNSPNMKVTVCHLPPGNPANRHNICISPSALPAHVIDFKPANNRCMGHMSGCHIGPCDPCGPGSTNDEIARAAAYKLQYNCH